MIECGFHDSVCYANAATTICQGAQLKESTVDPWHNTGHVSTNGGGHVEPHLLTRAIGQATIAGQRYVDQRVDPLKPGVITYLVDEPPRAEQI